MKSPLLLHMEKWKDGCGAPICKRAQHVCHIRGSVPAQVVFIGEAPGASEDVLGIPFSGPAGIHLQKYVIERSIRHRREGDKLVPTDVKYAVMNLTGCIPRDEQGLKSGAPDPKDIKACAPRLLELLDLCQPKLIVCVGKEAETALDPYSKHSVLLVNPRGQKYLRVPQVAIIHPSYIISKMHLTNQGLAFQRAALIVEQAIDEYVFGDGKVEDPFVDKPEDTKPGYDPIPF